MISQGGRFAPLRSLRLHGEWWTSPLLQLCLLSWLLAGGSAQSGADAAAPAPADALLAAASTAAAERESLSFYSWHALVCLHGTRLASSVVLQGIALRNGRPRHTASMCACHRECAAELHQPGGKLGVVHKRKQHSRLDVGRQCLGVRLATRQLQCRRADLHHVRPRVACYLPPSLAFAGIYVRKHCHPVMFSGKTSAQRPGMPWMCPQ